MPRVKEFDRTTATIRNDPPPAAKPAKGSFEEIAENLGLVKRNIELKAKLEARGKCLTEIAEALHNVHDHDEPFVGCVRGTCASIRDLLAATEA